MNYYMMNSEVEEHVWLEAVGSWLDFFEDVLEARKIENFNRKIKCRAIPDKKGRVLGDFPYFYSIPALSERAKGVLEGYFGSLVQIFPLETGRLGKFYFMNVLNVIDCLDRERSEIRYLDTGTIFEIKKYALKPITDEKSKIFKIEGHRRVQLYANEDTKKIVEDAGLEGFVFEPLPLA